MVSLANAAHMLERIGSARISVNSSRCVAVRNRNAGCRRCVDACTSGALSLDGNELVVQPGRCIGCGTCATVCPTCALEARSPSDATLAQAVLEAAEHAGGVAVVACRQIVDAAGAALDGDRVAGVECLGRVDESLLAALAEAGAQRAVLVCGRCETCDHAVGLQTAQAVAETANALFATWGSGFTVQISERFPAAVRAQGRGFDEGRRAFFFRAADDMRAMAGAAVEAAVEGQDPAVPAPLKVMDDGTLPHFVPDRRERLLDSLCALGEPADETIRTRLWGHVQIDAEACTACRMCATFCPTGALVRIGEAEDADAPFGLDHFPGDCVKCRCCEDICPAGALRVDDDVRARDVVDGTVERIELRRPAVRRGSAQATRYVFRDLLGAPDVFDR